MSNIQFDSGSYTFPGVPPTLLLESVVGGLANTHTVIGAGMWGPGVGTIGASIDLSALGVPPWPVKVAETGTLTKFAASFESVATVGLDLNILDPGGLLGLEEPKVHAQLYHAPALAVSPDFLFKINFSLVHDMSIGEIPLAGAFIGFTGVEDIAPFHVESGDYLVVRFCIDSNLASSVNGFHAQASVVLE